MSERTPNVVQKLKKLVNKYLITYSEIYQFDSVKKQLAMLESNKEGVFLDCGCGYGDSTLLFAEKIGTKDIFGLDLRDDTVLVASKRGIEVIKADLNHSFPYKNETFDVVNAGLVVAFLYDIDNFIMEAYRVLKPGGYLIISSDNLACWSSIVSLMLGFQDIHSQISTYYRIGNPLSPDYKKKHLAHYGHLKVPAYRSLKDILEIYGFNVENIDGAGYAPFPRRLASFLSSLDVQHSKFVVMKARKRLKEEFEKDAEQKARYIHKHSRLTDFFLTGFVIFLLLSGLSLWLEWIHLVEHFALTAFIFLIGASSLELSELIRKHD